MIRILLFLVCMWNFHPLAHTYDGEKSKLPKGQVNISYEITQEKIYNIRIDVPTVDKVFELRSLGIKCKEVETLLYAVSEKQLYDLKKMNYDFKISEQFVFVTGKRMILSDSSQSILTTTPCNETNCYNSNGTDVQIPDNGGWVYSPIFISCAPTGATVTKIDVHWEVYHTYWADLVIDLNDDNLTYNENLWNRQAGSGTMSMTRTNIHTFDNNEDVNQEWDLWARDYASSNTGYIDYWWIRVYYDAPITSNYGWPCNPQNSQHSVTGTFDEARKSGGSLSHFHKGIDIVPYNSPTPTRVYSVSSGMVRDLPCLVMLNYQ